MEVGNAGVGAGGWALETLSCRVLTWIIMRDSGIWIRINGSWNQELEALKFRVESNILGVEGISRFRNLIMTLDTGNFKLYIGTYGIPLEYCVLIKKGKGQSANTNKG